MNESNQQAAREWLPIESAPKDGDWFVAWASAGGHYVLVCWGGDAFYDDQGFPWKYLTHWSPVPTPPRQTQERSDVPQE